MDSAMAKLLGGGSQKINLSSGDPTEDFLNSALTAKVDINTLDDDFTEKPKAQPKKELTESDLEVSFGDVLDVSNTMEQSSTEEATPVDTPKTTEKP